MSSHTCAVSVAVACFGRLVWLENWSSSSATSAPFFPCARSLVEADAEEVRTPGHTNGKGVFSSQVIHGMILCFVMPSLWEGHSAVKFPLERISMTHRLACWFGT